MRSTLAAIRVTRRGFGMATTGVLATGSGIAIGVPTLVTLGLVVLLSTLSGLLLLGLDLARLQHGQLAVRRTIRPHPLSVGDDATVQVTVTGAGRARLDRVEISERAARELSAGGAPRARVARSPHRLELSYPVSGGRRGRWRTGPLEVRRTDIFGAFTWRGPIGAPSMVAVRPRVLALTAPGTRAALDARAAAGSRTSAPDDASLREYRPGDDLRRVHWASSARVGELVVRQDEQSGRRPATVLLDLPVEGDAVEWTISAGASIAAALLHSGHSVRIVVAGAAEPHRSPGAGSLDEILDSTIDLTAAPDRVTARAWFLRGLEALALFGAGRELVVAVHGALDERTRAEVARLGSVHEGWALVRTSGTPTTAERATIEALRRGGWTAVDADTHADPAEAWDRIQTLHETTVVSR